jgi:hypothetical protein
MLILKRVEADLVDGVAGVADQFAQEDLLVGIQGVGNEIEDLLELAFESSFFYSHVGHGCAPPFIREHFSPKVTGSGRCR